MTDLSLENEIIPFRYGYLLPERKKRPRVRDREFGKRAEKMVLVTGDDVTRMRNFGDLGKRTRWGGGDWGRTCGGLNGVLLCVCRFMTVCLQMAIKEKINK
ncbi:DWNN domain, partial [Striga asiatica]